MPLSYTFIPPAAFVDIPVLRGMVVLESDDGKEAGYTVWYPVLQSYSQTPHFYPHRTKVLASFAINTGNLSGLMSAEQIQELASYGCEIMVHGRIHAGLGVTPTSGAITAGDTEITLPYHIGRRKAGYKYRIWEGAKEEEFVAISVSEGEHMDAGTITSATPLVNSYGSGAFIELALSSIEDELLGCKADIEALGITVTNHVPPWHWLGGTPKTFVGEHFNSTTTDVTIDGSGALNDPLTVDVYELKRHGIPQSEELLDNLLDSAKRDNHILIIAAHADNPILLGYIIRGAISRGVRIATRQQMLDRFFN